MPFPFLPGVPPLSDNQIAAVTTFAAPAVQGILDALSPKWGIYNETGEIRVIEPDSFLSIEYINAMSISNYPIEKGAFASYNKVQQPFNAVVRMAKGGDEKGRAEFLAKLEELHVSLDLFSLVTPEKTYLNVSVERFDYQRTSTNGAGMIIASVHFIEIREAHISSVVATAPTAQPVQSNGQVRPASTAATLSGVQ